MALRDPVDERILRLLREDARMTNAALAAAAGLSPSACLRRLRRLEASGVIRGYTVLLDEPQAPAQAIVLVQITLERQSDDYLRRFEEAVRRVPEVRDCLLMAGDPRLCAPGRDGRRRRLREAAQGAAVAASRGGAVRSSFAIRAVIGGASRP